MCKLISKYGEHPLVIFIISFIVVFILTDFDTKAIGGIFVFAIGFSFITAFVLAVAIAICDEFGN